MLLVYHCIVAASAVCSAHVLPASPQALGATCKASTSHLAGPAVAYSEGLLSSANKDNNQHAGRKISGAVATSC